MLSVTQVFLLSLLFFGAVGAVGIWAALSARKAGRREAAEREAKVDQERLLALTQNAGTVR